VMVDVALVLMPEADALRGTSEPRGRGHSLGPQDDRPRDEPPTGARGAGRAGVTLGALRTGRAGGTLRSGETDRALQAERPRWVEGWNPIPSSPAGPPRCPRERCTYPCCRPRPGSAGSRAQETTCSGSTSGPGPGGRRRLRLRAASRSCQRCRNSWCRRC
jgi:hypothetical protein